MLDQELEFREFYARQLHAHMDPDDLPPAYRQGYLLEACLSHSDGKRIFLASAVEDGTKVIIKATLPDQGDSAAKEAAILETLCHPGIPMVLEQCEWNGWEYLVRQYFPGKTLDSIITHDGVMPIWKVLEIGLELTSLVHYLHTATPPLIHRDIKPQNLIMTPEGKICLIDFGIARKFNSEYPRDTVVLGSFGYAPPEQFGLSQTDPRSDIFALGGLLYFLATGKHKHYSSDLKEIPSFALRAIIARSTRLDARRRQRSAAHLGGNLELAMTWERVKKRKRQIASGAVAAAVVVCGFFGWTGFFRPLLSAGKGITGQSHQETGLTSPILAAAARESLGLDPWTELLPEHLEQVRTLYIDSSPDPEEDGTESVRTSWYPREPEGEVLDLEALGQLSLFPNLTQLSLIRQNIQDLSPLAQLQLTKLDLTGNNITNLLPLREMTSLQGLVLCQNPVSDLSPLAGMTWLTALDLSYTDVFQLEPLGQLKGLRQLDLQGCRATNLSVLGGLRELESLRLAYTQIKDFSFLPHLTRLKVLELRSTGFGDLSLIQSGGLRVLDLSYNYNYITDVSGIDRFERLEELDLSFTGVQDLSPIVELQDLEVLSLHDVARELPRPASLRRVVITGEGNRDLWETVGRMQQLDVVVVAYPTVY